MPPEAQAIAAMVTPIAGAMEASRRMETEAEIEKTKITTSADLEKTKIAAGERRFFLSGVFILIASITAVGLALLCFGERAAIGEKLVTLVIGFLGGYGVAKAEKK
jgi:hypothetical protein